MNSKISLIVILLAFFGVGCDKESDTCFVLKKIVLNQTEDVLFYYVQTTVGADSSYIQARDSLSLIFELKSSVSYPVIGPYSSIDIDAVGHRGEILYNLSDTTKYSFNYPTSGRRDSLYRSKMNTKMEGEGFNESEIETLYYSDVFDQIMSKDYEMLEQFSDYYE